MAWLVAVVSIAACGGGSAPAPPDLSDQDRAVLDTDPAANESDQPSSSSQRGYDGDRPVSESDQPPLPQAPAPPTGDTCTPQAECECEELCDFCWCLRGDDDEMCQELCG